VLPLLRALDMQARLTTHALATLSLGGGNPAAAIPPLSARPTVRSGKPTASIGGGGGGGGGGSGVLSPTLSPVATKSRAVSEPPRLLQFDRFRGTQMGGRPPPAAMGGATRVEQSQSQSVAATSTAMIEARSAPLPHLPPVH
jgi:hypothetical protein